MTQEDKYLLLKDLCTRLPYGVKAYVKNWSKLDRKYYEGIYTVESAHPSLNIVLACSDKGSVEVIIGYDDYVIKPYLFPMSSMTEEQKKELDKAIYEDGKEAMDAIRNNDKMFHTPWRATDWLNKNHFDYRGLIPMGLAKDATGLNIY